VPCTDCNGSGEPGNANCDQCHGSGQITAETAESSRDCADFIQRIEERFGFSRLLSLPSAFAATLRQLLTGQKLPRGGRPLLHQQASVDQSVFIMEDEYTKTLVLGYHDVVPHKDFKRSGFQSPDANIYKVDRADFSQHLGAILDNPTRWLFFRKLRKVVLTFDDGGLGRAGPSTSRFTSLRKQIRLPALTVPELVPTIRKLSFYCRRWQVFAR
jgi:hypothetical protein